MIDKVVDVEHRDRFVEFSMWEARFFWGKKENVF